MVFLFRTKPLHVCAPLTMGRNIGDGQSGNANTYQQIYDPPDGADLSSTKEPLHNFSKSFAHSAAEWM